MTEGSLVFFEHHGRHGAEKRYYYAFGGPVQSAPSLKSGGWYTRPAIGPGAYFLRFFGGEHHSQDTVMLLQVPFAEQAFREFRDAVRTQAEEVGRYELGEAGAMLDYEGRWLSPYAVKVWNIDEALRSGQGFPETVDQALEMIRCVPANQ